MHRTRHSPLLRLALAALVGLWSLASVAARGEALERTAGPMLLGAEAKQQGTVSASGLGTTAVLVNTLAWVDAGSQAEMPNPSPHAALAPEPAPLGSGRHAEPAEAVARASWAEPPLRHLLCTYRL